MVLSNAQQKACMERDDIGNLICATLTNAPLGISKSCSVLMLFSLRAPEVLDIRANY